MTTFSLEELLATKLRALYQRKKGRDLFDLWVTLTEFPDLDVTGLVRVFQAYLDRSGLRISRAEFEANLADKMSDPAFAGDVAPLLATQEGGAARDFVAGRGLEEVRSRVLALLPG